MTNRLISSPPDLEGMRRSQPDLGVMSLALVVLLLAGCVGKPSASTGGVTFSDPGSQAESQTALSPSPSGGAPGSASAPVAAPRPAAPAPGSNVQAVPTLQAVSRMFDKDHAGSEPSVKVAPDGSIYVCAPGGLTGTGFNPPEDVQPNPSPYHSSHLWRSDDGGATFHWLDPGLAPGAPMVVRGAAPGGGDCDIAVDPAGKLYLIDLSLADTSIAVSSDKGATWSWTSPLTGIPVEDRQWITSPAKDTAYIVVHELATGLWVLKSTDGGMTFQQQALAAPNGQLGPALGAANVRGCGCPPSPVVVLPDGKTLAVAWFDNPSSSALGVSVSRDDGKSWKVHHLKAGVGDTPIPFPAITADKAGNLYLLWAEGVSSPKTQNVDPLGVVTTTTSSDSVHHLRMRVSRDGGTSWSEPANITAGGPQDEAIPWVTGGDAGRIAVTFARSATGAKGDWHVFLAESLNAADARPTFVETQVSSTPALQGAFDRPLADFFQNALTADGRVMTAWTSNLPGQGRQMWFGEQVSGPPLLAPAK